jgi:hypothetical protein
MVTTPGGYVVDVWIDSGWQSGLPSDCGSVGWSPDTLAPHW